MASARKRSASVVSSDDDYSSSDVFGMSVDHFSTMFANIQHTQKTVQNNEEATIKKQKEVKVLEEKRTKKDASNKSKEPSKKESKEERLEKFRREREAKKDSDELRLWDDIEDILGENENIPVPSPEIEVIATVAPLIVTPELSTIKPKNSKKKTKGKKGSKKSTPVAPIVIPIEDDEIEPDVSFTFESAKPEEFASIHVTWKENSWTFSVDLHSKVSVLRQRISAKADTRAEDIIIFNGEDILQDDKTFLECGIKRLDTLEAMPAGRSDLGNSDPAMLKLKCQTQNRRQNFFVNIRKTSCLRQLLGDIAAKIGVTPEEVKLKFDGDVLNLDGTPESEGLEDGECIDVFA